MRHVHSRHCRATVNETKGWIVEGAVKWTVGAVISHFQ
jgi:SH3-like domain-containing protein